MVQSYYGVDLTNYNVVELNSSDYKDYDLKDVHFAINAAQKGLKAPTKIGIRRIKRRNMAKK